MKESEQNQRPNKHPSRQCDTIKRQESAPKYDDQKETTVSNHITSNQCKGNQATSSVSK